MELGLVRKAVGCEIRNCWSLFLNSTSAAYFGFLEGDKLYCEWTWLKYGMHWKMDSQTDWKELAWCTLLAIEIHCIVNIRPEENLWTLFQADIKPCDYRSTKTKFIFCLIKSALSFRSRKQDKIQALHLLRCYLLGFRGLVNYCNSFTGDSWASWWHHVLFGLFKVVNSINWHLNCCYRCSHVLHALTPANRHLSEMLFWP